MSFPSFHCSPAKARPIASGCGSILDDAGSMAGRRIAFGNGRQAASHDHPAKIQRLLPCDLRLTRCGSRCVTSGSSLVASESRCVTSGRRLHSCGRSLHRADHVVSAADEACIRPGNACKAADKVCNPAKHALSARIEALVRADQACNARIRFGFQKRKSAFLAQKASSGAARMPCRRSRVWTARPQTGHDTAQVCPSKHPDGFREALF